MPHDKQSDHDVIPVELIRKTDMPPYHYQEIRHGFGSAGGEPDEAKPETVPVGPKDLSKIRLTDSMGSVATKDDIRHAFDSLEKNIAAQVNKVTLRLGIALTAVAGVIAAVLRYLPPPGAGSP